MGDDWEISKALEAGGFGLGEKGLGITAKRRGLMVEMGWRFSRLHSSDIQSFLLPIAESPDIWALPNAIPSPPLSGSSALSWSSSLTS